MLYEVEGVVPEKPIENLLRIKELKHGELAVITEAGDCFGLHILMVNDHEGMIGPLCLDDATVRYLLCNHVCSRIETPDKVTLIVKAAIEGQAITEKEPE